MIKVGEHVTLDIIGTKREYDPSFFEGLVHKIADKAKVTVLNIAKYKFEPQGFTLVALLAESHISFHTYPEKGIISFDFYTCGTISPSIALEVIKKEIDHKRIVVNNFDRSSVALKDDIYSTPGQKKYYVVNDILEKLVSKVGQKLEILNIEEFGNALFIDDELQVSEKDEKLYSSTFVKSGTRICKKTGIAAVIGGGDGGVVRECLQNNFNFVDWFELDPQVVELSYKHLPKITSRIKKSNKVKSYWGDAFKSIKSIEDSKYDHIFVDLNDDQYCIDLAKRNMKGLKRILKKGGALTAQVGCQDKKPKQVKNWTKVLETSFGNTNLSEIFIPSFDCRWNFISSSNK